MAWTTLATLRRSRRTAKRHKKELYCNHKHGRARSTSMLVRKRVRVCSVPQAYYLWSTHQCELRARRLLFTFIYLFLFIITTYRVLVGIVFIIYCFFFFHANWRQEFWKMSSAHTRLEELFELKELKLKQQKEAARKFNAALTDPVRLRCPAQRVKVTCVHLTAVSRGLFWSIKLTPFYVSTLVWVFSRCVFSV